MKAELVLITDINDWTDLNGRITPLIIVRPPLGFAYSNSENGFSDDKLTNPQLMFFYSVGGGGYTGYLNNALEYPGSPVSFAVPMGWQAVMLDNMPAWIP